MTVIALRKRELLIVSSRTTFLRPSLLSRDPIDFGLCIMRWVLK